MIRTIHLHKTSQLGLRETNEDVEKYNINLEQDGYPRDNKYAPIDFFVVCDGHGGSSVAEFVAPKLEKHLMKRNIIYPLSHGYICKIYNYIQQELINNPEGIARACGCTALVVVRYLDNYQKENIQVINIGDCRAVLSRKGLAIPLCKDHKPFWSDEKRRIDEINAKYNMKQKIHFDAGDWRIGDLSVSRSFGDLDNTPYLTHIPDSFHYQLQADDEFIIMACDGLWDVIQNHEAVNFVRDHMHNNNIEYYRIPHKYPTSYSNDTTSIAGKLASYAIAKGSTDNVSILILFFKK
jgi:protein phosphatase 2C